MHLGSLKILMKVSLKMSETVSLNQKNRQGLKLTQSCAASGACEILWECFEEITVLILSYIFTTDTKTDTKTLL